MMPLKKIFFCIFFFPCAFIAQAQKKTNPNITINSLTRFPLDSIQKVCITELRVSGNKKTKLAVILHELPIKKGDSIPVAQINNILEQARIQVYNTTLFENVKLDAVITSPSTISIHVEVKERWYIYPIPQFQLVDRNFNDWYKTFHHSLSRVNYGIKFANYSLTGKRDPLRIYLINGYSRNISFTYSNPYINSALNKGFSIAAGYTQNREISYKTTDSNTVAFYPTDSVRKTTNHFVRNSFYFSGSYLIRKGFFTRQYFTAGYAFLHVDDSVIIKNPNYFKDSVTSKGYVDLAYTYQYTNVDNTSYSLKGISAYVSVLKRGWGFTGGINMLSIEAGVYKYIPLGKNWYTNFQLTGKVKIPFDQAYLNQRGLGYGESYLRGLEYKVVDGAAFALMRSTLKKKIGSFKIPFPFLHKVITKIPFTFFAKTFTDFGYVYNKRKYDTYLNNRLLYTGGFGIDVLTLYDINLRFEYSFNQLNKNGLFFHTQNGF